MPSRVCPQRILLLLLGMLVLFCVMLLVNIVLWTSSTSFNKRHPQRVPPAASEHTLNQQAGPEEHEHFWDHLWREALRTEAHNCSGPLELVRMDTAASSSLLNTMSSRRKVLPIPPEDLMLSWGDAALALDFKEIKNGRWFSESARESMAALPSANMSYRKDPLVRALQEGNWSRAAEAASNFFDDQAGVSHEPVPGVMVLRNSYLHARMLSPNLDCGIMWWGGCWRERNVKTQIKAARKRQQICTPKGPGIDDVLSEGFEAGGWPNVTDNPIRRYTHVASVFSHRDFNHFHMITEVFTRIFLLDGLLQRHPELMLHGIGTQSRTAEILHIIGVSRSRLLPSGNGSQWRACVDYLWLPETPRCPSNTQRMTGKVTRFGADLGTLHLTRAGIFRHLAKSRLTSSSFASSTLGGGVTAARGRYVVLTERTAGLPRHVLNQGELRSRLTFAVRGTHAVLEPVKKMYKKGMLVQQLAFFQGADAVVGPHGAALANIVAMRKGAAVVEFLPEGDVDGYPVHCYLHMAVKLELVYRAVVPKGAGFLGNWTVEVDQAAAALVSALSQGRYLSKL